MNRSRAYRIIRSGRVFLCVDPEEFADSGDPADLPSRPVTGLAQDARGYLWLGCEDGPSLFDGLIDWAPADLASLHGYSHHRFQFTDPQTLWIGAPVQQRRLEGVDFGCRTSVVYAPPDPPDDPRPSLSCLWELALAGRGHKFHESVAARIPALRCRLG